VRDAAHRTRCKNNLKQIGLALHQYHGLHNTLPPGLTVGNGSHPQPFMSWNTRILPFIEQSSLWTKAVEAYAQTRDFLRCPPHVLATVVAVYGCPADSRTLALGAVGDFPVAFTSYLGVEGTNQFRRDGVLFLDSEVRLSDITDGTSNTLMVGE